MRDKEKKRAKDKRGIDRARFPLKLELQMRIARKLASILRSEHAMGYPPIQMVGGVQLPRDEAAKQMDEQADRWETEIRTGVPNTLERGRMGC